MTHKKDKYLKIFKLELTSLVDDVSGLIRYEKELHEKQQHTNFVYLENLVVLKDEIMGINGILGEIDRISPKFDNYNYIDELINTIEEFIKKRGYPMAVLDMIKRKIKKIADMKEIY